MMLGWRSLLFSACLASDSSLFPLYDAGIGFHVWLACPPLAAFSPRAMMMHRVSPLVGVSASNNHLFLSMILHRVSLFVGVSTSDSFISP